MIPVKFLNFNEKSPDKGYWDTFLLEKIFEGPEFELVDNFEFNQGSIVDTDFGIIVIPARHNLDKIVEINDYINKFAGVVVIVAGDEEALFPVEKLHHSNMKVWLMTPHQDKIYTNVDRFIGEGITNHCALIPTKIPDKINRWFFAGQNTHKRRGECIRALRQINNGELIETHGFARGLPPEDYIKKMCAAKVVPCPSGPVTPDTFRIYEALEMGCVPIADAISSRSEVEGYWNRLFGENIPFPIIEDWSKVGDYINFFNDTFNESSNKIFAWWQMYKRNLKINLLKDFANISGQPDLEVDGLTVIIPTSPTSQNPDTSMIENTISTIRTHLPDVEIIITFDGVREEQDYYKETYQEFIKRVLWKCNREWKNVVPIVFQEHMHQVGMARETLKYVITDKILYVEHDAPLTPDLPIEWAGIFRMIDLGVADLVRFHYESFIPKEHEHLMLDKEPKEVCGIKAVRTIQWSQRPHVASTKFYRRILADHFSADAKTFIEDKMYSVVTNAYTRELMQGWNMFKLWIYHPDGQIKRSYHTDGRKDDPKYSMTF